jgi:hypothetical protein
MTTASKMVCETKFSIDTVQEVLQKYFKTHNTIESFEATEIGAGKGFLSVLARIVLHWKEDTSDLPKSVIVKIPSMRQMDRMSDLASKDESTKDDFEQMNKFMDMLKRTFGKVRSLTFIVPLKPFSCTNAKPLFIIE